MKQLLIFFSLLVFVFCSYGQKKPLKRPLIKTVNPNGFIGIGIFKIGADTNIVYEYAKLIKQSIKTLDNSETYFNDIATKNEYNIDSSVYRVKRNASMFNAAFHLDYCPSTTQYIINRYNVSGIPLTRVELLFYNNKLIEFSCDYNIDIVNAMTAKYGKSKVEIDHKAVNCVYNLTGISEKEDASTYYEKWINGPIEAFSINSVTYDNNCKKSYLTSFNYSIENKEYDKCWRNHLDDNHDLKFSKKSLKEF